MRTALTVAQREELLKRARNARLERKSFDLPPIVPGERGGRLALSLAQQRLWFIEQLGGLGAAYHLPRRLRLAGVLDRAALRRALDGIVARHEALRTTFAQVDGAPVQRVAPAEESPFALAEHDLSGEADAEGVLRALVAEETNAPFSLEHGPLIRGRLIRMAEDDHVLLLTMHHIVADAWSMGIFIREFGALYGAFRRGEPNPLPPLVVQYPDYAAWQRKYIDGPVLEAQGSYWRETLAGAPELLELPADRPRPARVDYAGASVQLALGEELTEGLKALSKRQGTTLFMTLLAGWAAVLSRLSGQHDVVIGTPAANRGRTEIEGLIGFFLNTLALRVDLSGAPSVAELLERVKARTLGAQQHQDLPFEQVVELLQPARSLAHHPVFQVLFSWQAAGVGRFELPGLEVGAVSGVGGPAQETAKFDLSLNLQESGGRIGGSLTYATALFDRATAERYVAYLVRVLEEMAADDAQPVAALAMMPGAERHLVVEGWNATDREYPMGDCLHELIEAQVARTPDAVALVVEGESLTYAELNARANRLAHHLRTLGVGPDVRVALCVERSAEMVVGLLGVLKSGGAYVPLDPSNPSDRLRFMLEDSAPAVVLTQAHLADLVDGIDVPVLALDRDASAWSNQSSENPGRDGLTPDHLAYMIYTSGSTGMPKGAMNAHRGVINRLFWMQEMYGLTSDDAVLQKTPYSFDVSVWEFFWPLLMGSRLVMARPDGHKDPGYLVETIRRERITTVHFVPSMLQVFLEHPETDGLTDLVRVVCSGEALPPAVVERFHSRLPGTELHNLYGPTEAAVDVTAWQCLPGVGGIIPIGRPMANTRMYVLDPSGAPVPVGVAGELYIAGIQVGRGYLGRPALTAEKFVVDPFSATPGARMYRTGDLGRWLADGSIEYLGRTDFQVKVRGHRIELGEIESRLAEHASVREAVVVAREDASGEKRLVAYCVSADELDIAALRAHLGQSLPEYMVPAAYVRLDALPLSANGKLDRKALPAPEGAAYARRAYEAPVGEVETALAELWAELLGVERVGRWDNFFELGGHSLLVVTLTERMRRRALHADVRALFATPVLAELAATVGGESADVVVPENRIPAGARAITPDMLPLVELTQAEIDRVTAGVPGGAANVQDVYPLAPLQEGILFHHLMATRGDPYLMSVLYGFESRERLDAYLGALQRVIDRHDILRTSVAWEGLPEPVQVVWRSAPLPVEEVELDAAAGDVARQLYARFDSRRHRIDVRRAPMLRACVARDENGRWLLLLLLHHLIDDNTSLRMLQTEVRAHLTGRAGELPPPLPFRTLVAQARLGVSRAEHEAFFRGLLGDVEEPTAPFGLLEARGDGRGTGQARLEVDANVAAGLRERARALGVTTASLLHMAWAQVLARVTGRGDVVFGTVLFGRMQGGEGADRVMGPFINTLPVRLRLDGGAEAGVREAHRVLSELMRHEHASLALAQRASGVRPPTPLFTSLLNCRRRPAKQRQEKREQGLEGMRPLSGEERTNYPLAMAVDDVGDGFRLTAQADASVDPARVCALMHAALAALVHALETAPETPLARLDVLPEAERVQVIEEWNATDAAYPRDSAVHALFEAQAKRTPAAVAIVDGDESLTYAELDARANRLARVLIERGVEPKTCVAILLPRSIDLVIAELAVLKAGGAYVPLDRSHPEHRLAFMVADSACRVVLTRSNEEIPRLDGVARVDVDSVADDVPDARIGVAASVDGEAAAYVMYTSGSTGEPKGVVVPHRAITQLVLSNGFADLAADDRVALASNPGFDASTMEVWGPLLNGGRIVVISRDVVLNPAAFRDLAKAQGLTAMLITPVLFQRYSEEIPDALADLRYVLTGGDRVDPAAYGRVLKRGGRVKIFNCYGPTETTTFSIAHPVESIADGTQNVPIGRPKGNTRVYLLDASGAPAPIGVAGELYIAGDGVALGYLNRPELTEERFLADPFSGDPDARMYRTGDLGRWLADGTIEFLGRNDAQVKVRGFRIELGEIEARLLEHADVREAVVVAREDAPGEKRLVAYVVAENASMVSADALRAHLGEVLPEYMVPAAYVGLDAIPLTPSGKVDRKALPAPEGDAFAAAAYEAPVGEAEEALAAIWAELLGRDRVGRGDHFFELGGHSLLAMQVVSRVREALGAEVPLAAVFAHPTVEALAARVAGAGPKTRSDRAIAVRAAGTQPPLFVVYEGAGSIAYAQVLLPHLDPELPVYALPAPSAAEPALRTVEGMAARLVRMIRQVRPQGPYRLAGWSFGGLLAYEAAAQLAGRDETVEFVAMLDTHHPSTARTGAEDAGSDHAFLLHMLRMADVADADSASVDGGESSDDAELEALVAKARAEGRLPAHVTAAHAREMRGRLRAHRRAIREYVPHPLPAPVHLFPAAASPHADPRRGWRDASVRVTPVPGTHLGMMEADNLRALGAALSQALAGAGKAAADGHAPLVTLRYGKPGGAPLFCVPGAGASVASFAELSGCLDPARAVHAFQPRGLDGGGVPHATVEAAAALYLRTVEEVQPAGPVHLLGHSFGGWVVFEMARRLRAAGREVGSLTLLDTDVPQEDAGEIRERDHREAFLHLVEIWEQSAERPLGISPAAVEALDEGGRMALLHDRLVKIGVMPARSTPEVLRGPFRAFATCVRTTYAPREAYPDPLRLVLVPDPRCDAGENRRRFAETAAGWRRLAPALELTVGAGNHMTALKPPHVRDLASLLTAGSAG